MNPGLLIIVDGWGHRDGTEGNAFRLAATPFIDDFPKRGPWTLLQASGEAVGLPGGVVGNSEIGHLTIGAGRVIEYESTRIQRAGESGELRSHPLHLIGLCSDGMVHADISHFRLLLEVARDSSIERVFLHPFTDGRDVPDGSAGKYLAELEAMAARSGRGRVASVVGRSYAMDRSGAWDRTQSAFAAIVRGEGPRVGRPSEALEAGRNAGLRDELIPPAVVTGDDGRPLGRMSPGDLALFVNFRGDRMRQLVEAVAHPDFSRFDRGPLPGLEVQTLTEYFLDPPVPALFAQADSSDGLADLLESRGVHNVRIAESEKFQHVTFFFNGRDNRSRLTEEDVHVPSRKVDYRLAPEMSGVAVAEQTIRALGAADAGLVLVNLANPDVVGHTGDLDAVCRAVETADACLRRMCEAAWQAGRWTAIVGDHGNAEEMVDAATGKPNVGHTANPVPFLLAGPGLDVRLRPDGSLADVAPTVSDLLGLDRSPRMEGEGLIRRSVLVSRDPQA